VANESEPAIDLGIAPLVAVQCPVCGDCTCDPGESAFTCPEDRAECGNGVLEPGEQCDDGNNDKDPQPQSNPLSPETLPEKLEEA